jgi:flavin-dependent dehydrogenase
MPKYDVVVVGAGTGGSVAAKTLADRGFRVRLIDQKSKGRIGDKVCGDAAEKFYFDDLGMPPPRCEELACGYARAIKNPHVKHLKWLLWFLCGWLAFNLLN